jgi:hypothetical protein
MKTIIPASSGSIRFLNLLKRRDAVLKIRSLRASVAGIQRYFCARHARIGRWNFFWLHQSSGSVNARSLSRKGSALHVLYSLISISMSLAIFANASSSGPSAATSSSLSCPLSKTSCKKEELRPGGCNSTAPSSWFVFLTASCWASSRPPPGR